VVVRAAQVASPVPAEFSPGTGCQLNATSVRIEVVVFGVERERAIDFEKGLRVLVSFLDKAKIHLPDAGLGGFECRGELGIEHQALSAVLSELVAGSYLARCLARELEGESGHAVGSTRIAMASIARADCVGAAYIEMIAVLGEKVDALLRDGFGQVPVPASGRSHKCLEFRM
jgi:hypothetical protein